jgi:hypothetical protein
VMTLTRSGMKLCVSYQVKFLAKINPANRRRRG